MIEPGAIVGRIRVERLIGQGGMGAVFAGTHLELDQPVAIKVLRDECLAEPVTVARFLREAKAVAKLRTEHVCRVFDVGRFDDGAPYIVMELMTGADLRTVMEHEPVPSAVAVDYIVQACIAVGEAHAAGIVHRDLKPGNLFRTRGPDGRPLVKVLDFGIAKAATAAEAKLTATASMMGTPAYASPEQILSARDVDRRTDIWALGATLYHLVTGRLPFSATRAAEMAMKVMHEPFDPIDPMGNSVDPGLAAVIARCLEKEPERRFASAGELAGALAPYGGPNTARFAAMAMPPTTMQPAVVPMASAGMPTAATSLPPHGAVAPPSFDKKKLAIAVGVLGVGGLVGLIVTMALHGGGGGAASSPVGSGAPSVARDGSGGSATSGSASTAPAPASVKHGHADPAANAARETTAPAIAAGTVLMPMPDEATRKTYEEGLADYEKKLAIAGANPMFLETVHVAAANYACMLGELAKVRAHYDALTDTADRDKVWQLCAQYGLAVPHP